MKGASGRERQRTHCFDRQWLVLVVLAKSNYRIGVSWVLLELEPLEIFKIHLYFCYTKYFESYINTC